MKLMILHFQPLEMYPPVMNLLNTFDIKVKENGLDITVFSTYRPKSKEPDFLLPNIKIKRTQGILKNENNLVRSLKYILFNCVALIYLFWKRPKIVYYYESFSAYPSIIYKKWFNHNCILIAHYHEYSTKEEFKAASRVVRTLWALEKNNFGLFNVLSHTNEKRMDLFKKDYPNTNFQKTLILPNYPPKSWSDFNNNLLPDQPIRLVYIGALSKETMYLEEICDWVVKQGDNAVLDIYTSNISDSAKDYLKTNTSNNIKLKGGVNYYDIPNILKNYHVGLILYKGHIPNFIHNAPNKLFEYLACGLDVWFPDVMEGSKAYVNPNEYPKVIALDFDNLKQYFLETLMDRNLLTNRSNTYYCEPIYENYWAEIKEFNIA